MDDKTYAEEEPENTMRGGDGVVVGGEAAAAAGTSNHVLKKRISSVVGWIDVKTGGVVQEADLLAMASNFGVAAIMGGCAGYATRKALKMVGVLFGVGFLSLQMLNYYGYVDVKWKAIEKDVKKQLDIPEDGKVDAEHFNKMRARLTGVLTHGVPNAVGFVSGFCWGIRNF